MKLTKKIILTTFTAALALTLTACGQSQPDKTNDLNRQAKQIEAENSSVKQKLSSQASQISTESQYLDKTTDKKTSSTTTKASTTAKSTADALAKLDYAGKQSITVNRNDPDFSKSDLKTSQGAWERYSDLDSINRATDANALLNKSLMPTDKRTPLTWNPTGWHNKKSGHGWLYNRSHLIGYQLSGENNNPKNLITGTRSLNAPEMLAHEMDIATYLKSSSQHFVRYEVKPIYRGQELLARGVQMRAQSISDNQVKFNVYIFNVEPGFKLNYNDGTSQKQ